jgi:hypothetical protein
MIRYTTLAIACALAPLALARSAAAHGPQIQVTNDAGKIVTRRLINDGPYGTALTAPTSVYVMPIAQYLGVWYSHPNGEIDPILHVPEFPSGPGLAYGYGYDAGLKPAPFPLGSQFVLGFADGLKAWNGSAFGDAGATEFEAFRGSGVNLVTARTSDSGPPVSIRFPSVISPSTGVSFAAEGAEAHTSVSFRFLGDGISTTSPLPDGIYLARFTLGSTAASLQASEPYYFVLTKRAPISGITAAVASLGVASGAVQFIPEPVTYTLVFPAVLTGFRALRRRRSS